MDENKTKPRTLPHSELDLNLMLTDSVWGRADLNPELADRLKKYFSVRNEKGDQIFNEQGQPLVTKESLWDLLGFYTRDMRLGNLSWIDNELNVCRYFINLANDFLTVDQIEPFLVALSRAATILETSQSKGGFLRRTQNTLYQHQTRQEMEPPKKRFMGGSKDKGNYPGGGY